MTELPDNIRRAARRLRLVTLAVTALVALGFLFGAWIAATGRPLDGAALSVGAADLPPVPAAIVLLLFGAMVTVALLQLAALLATVAAGGAFSVGRRLRAFAGWLFAATLVSVFAPPVLQLGGAWLGDGHGRATLSIGSSEALMLLVTGLLFLVARLLDEAQRVADDAAQIV